MAKLDDAGSRPSLPLPSRPGSGRRALAALLLALASAVALSIGASHGHADPSANGSIDASCVLCTHAGLAKLAAPTAAPTLVAATAPCADARAVEAAHAPRAPRAPAHQRAPPSPRA